MLKVRNALPGDIDWLLAQLRKFADTYGTAIDIFPDESYGRSFLETMIADHLLLVAEKPGVGLVGLAAGFVTGHPFNPKVRVLTETFWWVEPGRRGSRAASLLLDAFTRWGRANVDWIWFSKRMTTNVHNRSLEKRGYKHSEQLFFMEV